MILGKDITHVKIIELTGISDHVKLPDIAILQIRHTIIPTRSVTEKRMEIIEVLLTLTATAFDFTVVFWGIGLIFLGKQPQLAYDTK